MSYTDFTLEIAEERLGLVVGLGDLFPDLSSVAVPGWLVDWLERGRGVATLVSEKARSEFLVAPILLACRELVSRDLAIYSGQRLDVDPRSGVPRPDRVALMSPNKDDRERRRGGHSRSNGIDRSIGHELPNLNASRTGSCGGPSCGRISCVRPFGRRG